MKWTTTIATILGSTAILGFSAIMGGSAKAAGLNWTYQYDAVGDGSGGAQYDIKGIALGVQGNNLIFALTGGTPLGGVQHAGVTNGTISWGDFFLNFSGKSFKEAEAAGSLFGVRFAASNDSSVSTGIYSGVKTTSVATKNSGYSSLQQYYDYGWGKDQTQGSAIATKEQALNYYGSGSIQNSIASGTKVGEIALLLANDLTNLGLNFGDKGGSNTFGFSIDKSYLPSGSFLANVFLECGNDGAAFSSATAAPEPMTMAGTALGIAAIGGLKRLRRRREQPDA